MEIKIGQRWVRHTSLCDKIIELSSTNSVMGFPIINGKKESKEKFYRSSLPQSEKWYPLASDPEFFYLFLKNQEAPKELNNV